MAASSLAKQVQELRQLIEARNLANSSPVYLRDGEPVPEELEPKRVITIRRIYLDPPAQPEEKLPEILESSPAIERAAPPSFHRKLEEPNLGIV